MWRGADRRPSETPFDPDQVCRPRRDQITRPLTGTCRLHPDEFIRRFLLHVLPKGFRKIRHYGLSASSNVGTRLPVAQRLARALNRRARGVLPPPPATSMPSRSRPPRVGDRCPTCALGILVRHPLPLARGPPVLP